MEEKVKEDKKLQVKSNFHRAFGRHVQELRQSRGLKQEDLAYSMGVDRSYIGFIERGERNITLDKLLKLSNSFGISVSDLFEFENKK